MDKPHEIAQRRPAETAGGLASVVVLGYVAFGGTNPNMAAFLGAVAGLVPAATTWLLGVYRARRTTGG